MSRALDEALRAVAQARRDVEVAQKGLAQTFTFTSLLEARSRLHKAQAHLRSCEQAVRQLSVPNERLQPSVACARP